MTARRLAGRGWWLPACLCYAALAALTWTLECRAAPPRLKPRGMGGGFAPMRAPGGAAAPASPGGGGGVPYARVRRIHAGYALDYGFRNFNGNADSVQAQLGLEAVADAIREFGFRNSDIAKLDAWYQKARQDAVAEADAKYVKGEVTAGSREELQKKVEFINDMNASIRKELDDNLAALSRDYQKKREEVYLKAGFRFENANTIEPDEPANIRKNWKRVRPLAQAFARLAQQKGYELDDLVGAVSAMAQTSLPYVDVPEERDGLVLAGTMPPPETLVLGEGDCAAKTAVIASVLINWPDIKMVGLAIPGHYLLAYQRAPRSGEVYIEYQGLPYVMIEAAGPAWLAPGTVGDHTQAYLDSGQNFRIQPFTVEGA